jgi:predicted neutral ceramidase superfamily lipid hydrolase
MEFNQVETTEVEKIASNVESAIRELADLELALVGGGHGDVIL